MNTRIFIPIVLGGLALAACNGQQAQEQELALKEKELALRERELALAADFAAPTATRAETTPAAAAQLPFVGRKNFETEPGASGTGTPQRYLEIAANGDTYFGFTQQNQASGATTTERYAAGRFQPYLKCVFAKLDNQVRYYHVLPDKIQQVDANRQPLSSPDCCPAGSSADSCPCASGYY